jgi:hypothetical protein
LLKCKVGIKIIATLEGFCCVVWLVGWFGFTFDLILFFSVLFCLVWFGLVETGSCYVVQAGLEVKVLLPQPLRSQACTTMLSSGRFF